jgi:hypothetical protein
LDGCQPLPHPPPRPPPPPPAPPTPSSTAFCPVTNTTVCIAALAPANAWGTCSADFEHLEPHPIPSNNQTILHVDALHVDVQGTGHSDLHVVGLIYADNNGSPGALLATGTPVVLPAAAPRGFLRLPFAQPVSISEKAAGDVLWLGEQAGVVAIPGGSPPVPGGVNSLPCYGFPPAYSAAQPPCQYTDQPFTKGPRQQFGPAMQCSSSLSVFASTLSAAL